MGAAEYANGQPGSEKCVTWMAAMTAAYPVGMDEITVYRAERVEELLPAP